MESLKYKTSAMKSDQEDAMRAFQQRVQKAVNCEMVFTKSRKYDSKADGEVGKGIQEVEGQVRTLKLHLENRIGKVVPPNHHVIHWTVEYALETINGFRIVRKESTARELFRGKHEIRRMAEFGESVYYLPEFWPDGKIRQMEPKFFSGVWLGASPRTDEALIGTDKGLVRASTVKRKPIESAFRRGTQREDHPRRYGEARHARRWRRG